MIPQPLASCADDVIRGTRPPPRLGRPPHVGQAAFPTPSHLRRRGGPGSAGAAASRGRGREPVGEAVGPGPAAYNSSGEGGRSRRPGRGCSWSPRCRRHSRHPLSASSTTLPPAVLVPRAFPLSPSPALRSDFPNAFPSDAYPSFKGPRALKISSKHSVSPPRSPEALSHSCPSQHPFLPRRVIASGPLAVADPRPPPRPKGTPRH